MRRFFAITAFLVLISTVAALKLRQVSAQEGVIVAAPAPAATPYVAGPTYSVGQPQPVEAVDEQSQEIVRLQAAEARLAHEVESLSRQLSDANDEKQRTEIKNKLQETLTQQFDGQQQVRELEVARVEAKLKKLREIIAKRNEARRTIIDKRFEQLLRESEGLGWNSPTVGPGQFVPSYGAMLAPQPVNFYRPVRTEPAAPGPRPR